MVESRIKLIVQAVIILCMIIASIPFITDFIKTDEAEFDDKKIELYSSNLSGYKNGMLSWKIFADKIWSKKSRYLFYADSIVSGVIYDDNGKVVIDSIKANNVKINTRSNSIFISNGVNARIFTKKKDSEKGLIATTSKNNQIQVKSKELRFFNESKKTFLSEDVELVKKDTTIKPLGEIEIDTNKNIAYIYNGFSINSSDFKVSGNSMVIYIDEEQSFLKGDLVFEKLPSKNIAKKVDEQEEYFRKKSTFLYCDSAFYNEINDQDRLEVSGNLVIIQDGKKITASEGLYNESTNSFILEHDVKLQLRDLGWILDKKKKKELTNKDIKNSLNLETEIIADKLHFNGDVKQTRLFGNILVTQPDKKIWCDKLVLYDEEAIVECFGNVKLLKENKDSILSEYLKIDLKNENFIARDKVFSEYYLKNEN